MDFRVYVIIEAPIIDKKYELFVPIDRRIHDLINALKKTIPDKMYDWNVIIKNSDIKMGTRLVLV